MEMEMRASEDIVIGEDIIQQLLPLSFSLHNSFLQSHCSSCFSPLPNPPFPPIPTNTATISHCQYHPLYCSPLCSSTDSPLHFSSSESFLPFPSSADLRVALRLLQSLPSTSTQRDRISGLLTNHHKLISENGVISAQIRDGAKVMAAARRLNQDDVVLLEAALSLVLTNAVDVLDKGGHTLGIAVYGPNFSWINHSCSPNACYCFSISPPDITPRFPQDSGTRIVPGKGEIGVYSNIELTQGYGPRIIVRSIKRIKQGEEVTIAYTDLLQPKTIRQSELWSKYCFTCCCTRCSASPPSYVDHNLQAISYSNPASSSSNSDHGLNGFEATRRLTDYVDDVINEYLSVGDPEFCCERLESMLIFGLVDEQSETKEGKAPLNFRLNPVHHLALKAYMTMASAFKMHASDLLALHSEVERDLLVAFNMSRISAAYSFLLAAATYHLFCFEPSLIASVANFWTGAGESLLSFARSPAWALFGKWGLHISKPSSLAKHKCSKCSLLDRFEANLTRSQGRNADLENILNEFIACIAGFSEKVWSFLVQDCHYLKIFKDPLDFSWLAKSSNVWEFEADLGTNMYSNSWNLKGISRFDAQVYTYQKRIEIFQLGVHCLLYGGFLASICYGPHSHLTSYIQGVLDCGEQ